MIQKFANTTAYLPRHAAPRPTLLDSARALVDRVRPALAWIDRQLDKDMSGPWLFAAGAIMGLFFGPLIMFCYFG